MWPQNGEEQPVSVCMVSYQQYKEWLYVGSGVWLAWNPVPLLLVLSWSLWLNFLIFEMRVKEHRPHGVTVRTQQDNAYKAESIWCFSINVSHCHCPTSHPTGKSMRSVKGPQPFWHEGLVLWKIIFPQTGWFWDDWRALHLLHTLFQHIVINNEIIIQLTIMENWWEPWACCPATRWTHLGGDGRQWPSECVSLLWEVNAATELTGGRAQVVMQATENSYKHRSRFAGLPTSHFLLCGPVPNRGWRPLMWVILLPHP